ncbi:MAG TPA: ABC transporter permease [Bacteroidales bacterium]|nr:ABC transporter permease [Bacteroidales bacterium]HPE55634.1 ABC transporter permease [Bacteroidales bacterium]HRX96209.1 ABC transporter permease [Bacteroidales bacterium]
MLTRFGKYILIMLKVFRKPDKMKVFWRQLVIEINNLGIESLGIVAIISVFMGAVVAIQTAYNIDNPLLPLSLVGFTTRQSVILEFSPTIISLILAGKVGSRIASEIGTMRVTEQIDALEIMGINPANYLIFPKITAAMIFNPVVIILSMGFGIMGGYFVSVFTTLYTPQDYLDGLRLDFDGFTIAYATIKTIIFAFLITSIAGFEGYSVKGGAIDVGASSTRAVVWSSIMIILFNLILTHLLLS